MSALRRWLTRLAAAFAIRRDDRDFDAELQGHLQLHIDDGIRGGLSPAAARRQALVGFGSIESVREAYREQAGIPALRLIADACRQAARAIIRHPRFNLTAAAILALGVGSTAAMTGAIDALLFRPPDHVREPETLVEVMSAHNYPQYQAIASRSGTLAPAAFTKRTLTLGQGETARPVETQCVTPGFFTVLGTEPASGRSFGPADEVIDAPPVAVLSYGVWRREFGGDAAAVGRVVPIGGVPHAIVGVAPAGFRGVEMAAVDAWILLPKTPELCTLSGRNELASTRGSWLTVIGRLNRGAGVELANREIATLALGAMAGRDAPPTPELRSLEEWRHGRTSRDGRLAVWLAVGSALVLLICCANVAGLLSVRAIERRHEIAVRVQLGSTRGRLFLQLLAENLALAGVCILGAWAVAGVIGSILRSFFPAIGHDAWFDPRTVLVLLFFAGIATVMAGVVPAAQTARVATAPGHAARPSSLPALRFRNGLLVAQIAFALVLSVGAGLFAASVSARKSGLGYDLDRVVVATFDLERAGIRRQAAKQEVIGRMLDRVRTLAPVESVALTSASPLGSGQSYVALPSGPPGTGPADALTRIVAVVSAGYFGTVGARILDGRSFRPEDAASAPPVAIVDTALAQEMWPGERVVGRCMVILFGSPCVEIVGLSEPRRTSSLTRAGGEIFYPLAQRPETIPQALLVRARGRVDDAVPVVAAAIRGAAANLPYVNVQPLESLANVQARSWRLGATLFGLFGALALVLAAVGIYASLAFAVRQRTAEIGVRLTLGANSREIVALVLRQGARVAAVGWAAGVVGSLVLARAIASLLFGIAPTDAVVFAAASTAVGTAVLLGCLVPAIRAARIDPVVALRNE